MSSYVKATNFATKDSLPTGDSNKIVKGTEIDNELNSIAGAISSKADTASPSFTGTPAAPTATTGSNTTQVANTAYVKQEITANASNTETLTNKTVNLTSNTLTGTLAQFNTACSNADFVSLAGTETLTNKTLTSPSISSPALSGVPTAPTATAGTNTTQVATTAFTTAAITANNTAVVTLTNKTVNLTSNTLTGTVAQFNTALSDDNFATLTGTETLTNKTLTSPAITGGSLSSPTMTGTPVAPTATSGTNTTQVATTAFVTTALQAVYPVGSIYINASSSTNPATLLGFGTWTAFGAGRMMVGLDAADALFDTAEETGGTKDTAVVAHTHTYSSTTGTAGNHTHSVPFNRFGVSGGGTEATAPDTGSTYYAGNVNIPAAGDHTHTVSGTTASTGSSGTNTNLPPYIVVRMWKRTV